jgi:hypothetical protein
VLLPFSVCSLLTYEATLAQYFTIGAKRASGSVGAVLCGRAVVWANTSLESARRWRGQALPGWRRVRADLGAWAAAYAREFHEWRRARSPSMHSIRCSQTDLLVRRMALTGNRNAGTNKCCLTKCIYLGARCHWPSNFFACFIME